MENVKISTLNGAGSNPVGSRSVFLFLFCFFYLYFVLTSNKQNFSATRNQKNQKSTNLCNMEIMSKTMSMYFFRNEFFTLGSVFPNFWYFSRDQHKKRSQKTYLFLNFWEFRKLTKSFTMVKNSPIFNFQHLITDSWEPLSKNEYPFRQFRKGKNMGSKLRMQYGPFPC